MRFLPVILLIVLAIYCLVEIWQSDAREVRLLPRAAWVAVVLVPLFGPVGWLVWGRPNGTDPGDRPPKQRPTVRAPDDDPDFLRNLGKRPGKD